MNLPIIQVGRDSRRKRRDTQKDEREKTSQRKHKGKGKGVMDGGRGRVGKAGKAEKAYGERKRGGQTPKSSRMPSVR